MALLVKYKCEQTIPSIYQLSTRNIKQVIDINNKHMQDINTSEREMSNRKHGRFVSRFEHTCSTSPPSTLWRIFTITILQDHSVPQHLQWVHTRTLGLTSPSLIPSRTTQHEPISCPRPNLYNTLQYKVEHLVISSLWSPTSTLTNKSLIR